MDTKTPPVAYADVVFRNLPKPKKEVLTQEQIQAVPELLQDITEDLNSDREPIVFDKEQIELIRTQIEHSNCIVGLRPISIQSIKDEATKLIQNGIIVETQEKKKIMSIATKNIVMRFFRDRLKMSDEIRNSLEISKIFPSRNPDSQIMYIQCMNTEEISKITSHAKNIIPSNLKETSASIAIHIPKFMYERYISLERFMFQLRQSSKGNIQTNIRLGRTDFIVRQKLKQDTRKWKDVVPLEIPPHIAKPDIQLLTNKNKQEDDNQQNDLYNKENDNENEDDDNEDDTNDEDDDNQDIQTKNIATEDENNKEMEDDTDQTNEINEYIDRKIEEIINEDDNTLSETNGSISNKLKNTTKHKRSPQNTTADKRKKIIPDEYDEAIEKLASEIDIIEQNSQSPAGGKTPQRSESMDALMEKIPKSINITKVQSNTSGQKLQA